MAHYTCSYEAGESGAQRATKLFNYVHADILKAL